MLLLIKKKKKKVREKHKRGEKVSCGQLALLFSVSVVSVKIIKDYVHTQKVFH